MKEKFSFSQFQKLGKVLMTPVMIMPIAGILVGVGSAFTTKNIVVGIFKISVHDQFLSRKLLLHHA